MPICLFIIRFFFLWKEKPCTLYVDTRVKNATGTIIWTQDLVYDRAWALSPCCISNLILKTANFYLVNFSWQKISITPFIHTKLESIKILNNFLIFLRNHFPIFDKMEKFFLKNHENYHRNSYYDKCSTVLMIPHHILMIKSFFMHF